MVIDGSKLPDAKLLVGDVYDLGPDGTKFLKPVTLTFDLGGAKFAEGEVPTLAYLEKDAWRWLEDSAVKNGKVVATTTHFSRFTVKRNIAPVAPIKDAGATDDASASKGTSYGCERGSSADQSTHSCTDDSFNMVLGQDLLDKIRAGCEQAQGKIVSSCDLTGSVGGCRVVFAKAGEPLTRTVTVWHYTGDVDSEVALCEMLNENNEPDDPKNVYVAP